MVWPLMRVADHCVEWCAGPQKNTMCAVSVSQHRHRLHRCLSLFVVLCFLLFLDLLALILWFAKQVSAELGVFPIVLAHFSGRSHLIRAGGGGSGPIIDLKTQTLSDLNFWRHFQIKTSNTWYPPWQSLVHFSTSSPHPGLLDCAPPRSLFLLSASPRHPPTPQERAR